MDKMWQKVMLFAISLVLGLVLITQVRTRTAILGIIDFDEKTLELSEELAKLNLEKNRIKDELEALKEENRKNQETFKDTEEELAKLSKELEIKR